VVRPFQIPSIQTPHLTLCPLQPADAVVLHRIYQSEGVLRYFPNPIPPPLEKVQRFLAGQQAHWEKYGYGNWGILPEGEKEIVGWAGLQFVYGTYSAGVEAATMANYWCNTSQQLDVLGTNRGAALVAPYGILFP